VCRWEDVYVQSSARAVRRLSIDFNIIDGFVILYKFSEVVYL
jgi:hypothetical protein